MGPRQEILRASRALPDGCSACFLCCSCSSCWCEADCPCSPCSCPCSCLPCSCASCSPLSCSPYSPCSCSWTAPCLLRLSAQPMDRGQHVRAVAASSPLPASDTRRALLAKMGDK